MPRKRASNAARLKPTAAPHPSLTASGSSSPSAHHSTGEHSVNTLLADLRRGPPRQAPPAHRNASNTSKDVESSTSPALFLPLGSAPPARPLSPRSRMAERRRARGPPGPRPPPSWSRPMPLVDGLEASVYASTPRRQVANAAPHEQQHFDRGVVWSTSQVPMLPHLPLSTSLQMIVLAHMARHWSWHAANDLDWLGVLPVPVRESLLWMLADHGQTLNKAAMQALVAGSAEDMLLGWKGDISEAPDSWETPANANDAIHRLAIGPSLTTARAYRWLGDVLVGPGPSDGQVATLQVSLTHLSLVAAPAPSWTRLIALAPSLPHLIHLDLAGWPSPESLAGSGGVVLPADPLEQSARTLKRLGRALSGLQWLGLDGCGEWMGAWFAGLDGMRPDDAEGGGDGRGSGAWSAWEGHEGVEKNEQETTHATDSTAALPPPGHVDWPRAFYSLRTLRLSLAPNTTLKTLLASEESWKEAVTRYTHSSSYAFPPISPYALLRVPEPHPPARDYEGPRWTRPQYADIAIGMSGVVSEPEPPTTTYTLQAAHRLPAYRAVAGWLGAAHAMADLESRVRRVRRAYSSRADAASPEGRGGQITTATPFTVHRTGIDDPDAPLWLRDVVERWTTRRKGAGYKPMGNLPGGEA